ncbi:unnamed protein product, partial [Pleuronectes platessa]
MGLVTRARFKVARRPAPSGYPTLNWTTVPARSLDQRPFKMLISLASTKLAEPKCGTQKSVGTGFVYAGSPLKEPVRWARLDGMWEVFFLKTLVMETLLRGPYRSEVTHGFPHAYPIMQALVGPLTWIAATARRINDIDRNSL